MTKVIKRATDQSDSTIILEILGEVCKIGAWSQSNYWPWLLGGKHVPMA